jgi:formyl-CoA transferase
MRWPGPELGEHTEDVLTRLAGTPASELVELRRQGVI